MVSICFGSVSPVKLRMFGVVLNNLKKVLFKTTQNIFNFRGEKEPKQRKLSIMYYNKRSKGNMTSLLVKYNQTCVFDYNWLVHI